MKKIGICTFYNNNNYGSYLQSYALLNKVRSLGYDAYIIDFKDYSKSWNRRIRNITILNRLKCIIGHPMLLLETVKARFVSKASTKCSPNLAHKFTDFSNRHLSFYSGDYTDGSFHAFIAGSDQVWKITLPGLHYVFFLQFCCTEKRISYAASLGSDKIPNFNRKVLCRYLKSFKAISVREDSAIELLNSLGLKLPLVQVLDPVLLVGEKFWLKAINPEPITTGYVFLYFLDPLNDNVHILNRILARYSHCKILMIDTGVRLNDVVGIKYIEPTPLEFVSLIKNSDVVVTDSFHGTAFSLLFTKEFYVIPRNYSIYPGQRDRLLSLLRMFNCSTRYIDNLQLIDIIDPIDPLYLRTVLDEQQKQSNEFLVESIL